MMNDKKVSVSTVRRREGKTKRPRALSELKYPRQERAREKNTREREKEEVINTVVVQYSSGWLGNRLNSVDSTDFILS